MIFHEFSLVVWSVRGLVRFVWKYVFASFSLDILFHISRFLCANELRHFVHRFPLTNAQRATRHQLDRSDLQFKSVTGGLAAFFVITTTTTLKRSQTQIVIGTDK